MKSKKWEKRKQTQIWNRSYLTHSNKRHYLLISFNASKDYTNLLPISLDMLPKEFIHSFFFFFLPPFLSLSCISLCFIL